MPGNNLFISNILKYLQAILLVSGILYFGKILFIPLFFGLLIAIIMHPVCKWFENHRLNKSLAIFFCLLIVTIVLAALLALLVWQLRIFSKDAPEILARLGLLVQDIDLWITKYFRATIDMKHSWQNDLNIQVANILKSSVQVTVSTLFMLFLTPVYTTLFMYHRKVFVQYLQLITPANHQPALSIILQKAISTYFRFIKGMTLVYIIVGILNSIGLFALGVRNAILFGFLCSIMTIIPYIGISISALLPISIIWLETNNVWYPLGVIAVFSIVQYLEANVIFPKVVGTQLEVSTLAMLVAVIAGGIIWGVAGMILFIPFLAILKIISDHIKEWKPLNVLLSRN